MLKTTFIFYLSFIVTGMTYASDPFDRKERMLVTSLAVNEVNTPVNHDVVDCSKNVKHIAETVSFEQLSSIGVIQRKNQIEALFVSKSQGIFNIKIGESLGKERLIVTNITLREISLKRWKDKQCSTFESFTVTL